MAKVQSRRSQVAKFKREGYSKSTFETEKEADAFVEGFLAGIDPYADHDVETLPPVKKKRVEWTVYHMVKEVEPEYEGGYFG